MSGQDFMPYANPNAVADALMQARRNRRTCDAQAFAGALHAPADAYTVQALVAHAIQGPAAPFPRFWKSGGPSRAAVPTHAALPAEGVWRSPADARDWPFNLRLIEAEIALRLAHEVTPAQAAALAPEEAAALVDAMTVAIEVVDSRWQQGVQAPALLKLADFQSHGALVLGEWVPYAQREWQSQLCEVRIGGQPSSEWCGTHSLGDPLWVLPSWLRHATRSGLSVPAGTIVTTGTWCGMLPAVQGNLVTALFDGVGEAAVQL